MLLLLLYVDPEIAFDIPPPNPIPIRHPRHSTPGRWKSRAMDPVGPSLQAAVFITSNIAALQQLPKMKKEVVEQLDGSMHVGVLALVATKRDSVSTYSRNYKPKRERLPCSNTRGGRPKHDGPTQGGKTRLCRRQVEQARSNQPHAADPAWTRAIHPTRSGTEPEEG